jgi:hypothetical protein
MGFVPGSERKHRMFRSKAGTLNTPPFVQLVGRLGFRD